MLEAINVGAAEILPAASLRISERHEVMLRRGYVMVLDNAGRVVTEAVKVARTRPRTRIYDGKVGVIAGGSRPAGAPLKAC